MAQEQFTNGPSTTLASTILLGATSLTVNDATGFPTTGNFRIRIDSEIILVTAVSGTTFTITRAQEGTTAAGHSGGATVTHVLTAGALEAFREDNIGAGAIANRPTVGETGRIYIPNDGLIFQRDNGTTWQSFGPLYKFVQPPAVSSFTWRNQGTATATDQGGRIYLTDPVHVAVAYRWLYRPNPGATFTVTTALRALIEGYNGSGSSEFGLGFADPTAGKVAFIRWRFTNGNQAVCSVGYNNNNDATFATHQNTAYAHGDERPGIYWLRCVMGASNREYWISFDGVNWIQSYSESKTLNFTPTHVALIWSNIGTIANTNLGGQMPMTVFHWEEV